MSDTSTVLGKKPWAEKILGIRQKEPLPRYLRDFGRYWQLWIMAAPTIILLFT